MPSGVLPEQLDPLTGAALSVSPLAWSHAALVTLVQEYQRKVEQLRQSHDQRLAGGARVTTTS